MRRKRSLLVAGLLLLLLLGHSIWSTAQSRDVRLYDQASRAYHNLVSDKVENTAVNWEKVVTGFSIIVNEYPQSEKADDAQYSIGLCYLRQEKYEEAITAFQRVTRRYPESNLADDSQYLIGYSYYSMDNLPEAIEAFQVVLEEYSIDAERAAAIL